MGFLPCDLIIVDKAIRKACLAVCKVEFVHSDEALQGRVEGVEGGEGGERGGCGRGKGSRLRCAYLRVS